MKLLTCAAAIAALVGSGGGVATAAQPDPVTMSASIATVVTLSFSEGMAFWVRTNDSAGYSITATDAPVVLADLPRVSVADDHAGQTSIDVYVRPARSSPAGEVLPVGFAVRPVLVRVEASPDAVEVLLTAR